MVRSEFLGKHLCVDKVTLEEVRSQQCIIDPPSSARSSLGKTRVVPSLVSPFGISLSIRVDQAKIEERPDHFSLNRSESVEGVADILVGYVQRGVGHIDVTNDHNLSTFLNVMRYSTGDHLKKLCFELESLAIRPRIGEITIKQYKRAQI